MDNQLPKVSILIPVYKVPERYLRKCLSSAVNQTLKEIEIIIVDDGSPDNCGLICDEYALLDNRIKVIHKRNEGLAAARNTAFDCAQGEYITFLDGDDFLDETACAVAYETAKLKNVQLVFWNQYTEYPNSSQIIKTIGDKELEFRGQENCSALQMRVLDFNGKIAQVFSKLIEREYLIKNKVRHNDELKQGAEGFIFNILLFENLESAYYLPQPLLHYTYNENSISHTPNEQNYYMILRCFEYVEKYIQSSKNKELLERNLYNRILYVVVTTGITGYFNPANKTTYREKVEGYRKFLQEPLVCKALERANFNGVSFQRKFIIQCLRMKQYWIVAILGKIRKWQLSNR